MNKRNLSILIAAVTASVLVCCSKQSETDPKIPENGDGQYQSLELSYVGATETKAAIDGNTFPQNGEIGLFLFKEQAATTPYGQSGYTNVKYAYNSDKKKWTANPSIKVGSTPGYLYGYYPYDSKTESINAIPVLSSLNGDDVMYASQQSEAITDKKAANTTITMNHALARVSITVVNKGYTGNAKLSSIKFADAEIAESGTLNAVDGTITATKAEVVTLSVPETLQTIATGNGTTYECLLVPSAVKEGRQNVALTLKIDGQEKSANLTGDNGVIFGSGVKSRIVINLSNSGISVAGVSINDWQTVEVGGHKVTVKRSSEDGIADDVFLDVTSNGSTVTIKSLSALTGRRTSCSTPAGKATCTPSIDATTGICTFTITNVQDDITAEVGYLKYDATVEYDSDKGAVKLNGATVASGIPVQILHGEEAVFTAEANTGISFIKWTDGKDNDLSTDNPYTVSSVTSDITLKAIFECEIAAEVKPAGAGTVTGAGIYAKGSTVTLTATAGGSGVEFTGWAKADSPGTIVSTDNPYEFTASESTSYVAVFRVKDALSGVFTVAADAQGNPTKKVQFSKGNLYCSGVEFNENGTVKSIANAQWGFEANQYDTTPSSNNVARDENHISHFMWCADADSAMTLKYDDKWNKDETFFAGKNFTVNDYSGWHTLSTNEWQYLFNTRTNAGDKVGYATVGGANGIILLPDTFIDPMKNGGSGAFAPKSKTGYDANVYTTGGNWEAMESAGAVFLPAAGWRSGGDGYASVYDVGIYGYYWSASPSHDSNAYGLDFLSISVVPNQDGARGSAQSVRLVTE